MRTLAVLAPSKLYLEKWKKEFMKCEEFDLHSDEGESLSTKQDEHDPARPDEEAEVIYMAMKGETTRRKTTRLAVSRTSVVRRCRRRPLS